MTDFASLCLLSYNRPEFLREAVATLHAYSKHPFELIVHDDGSDSATRAVVEEFVDAGLVSTAILNPAGHNQGQGIALNRMFNMAKGDPIIKLDHDLIFHEGWLDHVVGLLKHNAQMPRVLGNHRGLTESGRYRDDRTPEPLIGLLGLFHYHHDPVASVKCRLATHGEDGLAGRRGWAWEEHTHICGSGFAVTRRCWRKLGPFEEHSDAFAEDWVFQRRVTESEDFVCALPQEDLITNQGFGVGPSTLVLGPNPGEVQAIHKEPVIHGR